MKIKVRVIEINNPNWRQTAYEVPFDTKEEAEAFAASITDPELKAFVIG